MKKLQIKLTFKEALAIDNCLSKILDYYTQQDSLSYGDKCVWATLESWRIHKLHPKTHYRTESGVVSLKLDAASSMALASIMSFAIPNTPQVYQDQAFNKLTQIFNAIDQHFK